MSQDKQFLDSNKKVYDESYAKQKTFLRYPSETLIYFHHLYMKNRIPSGKVLDYGCGSGNNSLLFIDKGYDTYGVDVSEHAISLIKENLMDNNLDRRHINNFSVISPDSTKLAFEDCYFDFIFARNALYYLPTEDYIRKVCNEFKRCLKPGGMVLFTMMGQTCYYISKYTKKVHNDRIHEVLIDEPGHRLFGHKELIYVVRDKDDVKNLFSDFNCITTGYTDFNLSGDESGFHWIFIGEKTK
jgi:SAM-dependent methyltransferase